MKFFKYFIFLAFSFSLAQCDHFCGTTDSTCYEFDRRQCKGDSWAEVVPEDDSKKDQEEKMKAFLSEQGISVEKVTLVQDFHEFVCEACVVCPQGDRFFVKVSGEEDFEKLEALELLALAETSCDQL